MKKKKVYNVYYTFFVFLCSHNHKKTKNIFTNKKEQS